MRDLGTGQVNAWRHHRFIPRPATAEGAEPMSDTALIAAREQADAAYPAARAAGQRRYDGHREWSAMVIAAISERRG